MASLIPCPTCEHENPTGAGVCANCEARLETGARSARATPPGRQPPGECPSCGFPLGPEPQRLCPVCGAELEGEASSTTVPADGPGADVLAQVVVPPVLRDAYTLVEEMATEGNEAQLFLMSATETREPSLLKLYRLGQRRGDDDLLQEIQESAPEHVVRVESFGHWGGRLWELLEYCPGGSLRSLIEAEGPRLPDALIRTVLVEISTALTHLHERELLHRDIKPSNILIRTPLPELDLVLADFGLLAPLDGATSIARSGDMTAAYAPPEAHTRRFSRASDWWSLGIILMEMLLGRHPASNAEDAELTMGTMVVTRDLDVTAIAGERWQQLCAGLLTRNPQQRWGAKEVADWLDGGSPTVHRSLQGGGDARSTSSAGFNFYDPEIRGDRRFVAPEDLAAAMGAEWERTLELLHNPQDCTHLARYLSSHFPNFSNDSIVAPSSDLPAERRLIALLSLLDPHAPPRYRGKQLIDGNGALAGELGDLDSPSARKLAVDIYDNGALNDFAHAEDPQHPSSARPLREVQEDWQRIVQAAEATIAGLSPELRAEARAEIVHRALIAAFSPAEAARLKAAAAKASSAGPGPSWWTSLVGRRRAQQSEGSNIAVLTFSRAAAHERAATAAARRASARRKEAKIVLLWTLVIAAALIAASLALTFQPQGKNAAPAAAVLWRYLGPSFIAGVVSAVLAGIVFDTVQSVRSRPTWAEEWLGWNALVVVAIPALCILKASSALYVPPASWAYLALMPAAAHIATLLARGAREVPLLRQLPLVPPLLVCLLAGGLCVLHVPAAPAVPSAAEQLAVDRALAHAAPLAGCRHVPLDANEPLLRDSLYGEISCTRGSFSARFLAFRNRQLMDLYASTRAGIALPSGGQSSSSCASTSGVFAAEWHERSVPRGEIVCRGGRGDATVEWSDSRTLTYSVVHYPDRALLSSWWRSHQVAASFARQAG